MRTVEYNVMLRAIWALVPEHVEASAISPHAVLVATRCYLCGAPDDVVGCGWYPGDLRPAVVLLSDLEIEEALHDRFTAADWN